MALLPEQLTRDIAQAFHMGLRQDTVSAQQGKELAIFLFGLAHLAEGNANSAAGAEPTPAQPADGANAAPVLSHDEALLEQMRRFLSRTNAEQGYAVKSPLLNTVPRH